MYLIIAEKPSLARNIIAGIGKMNRFDGYYQNDEYIVTWVFGHLFSLCDIEDYTNEESRYWTMKNLPYFPIEFKFSLKKDVNKNIDKGVQKQFNLIKRFCNDDRVDAIVNAGDADREGEIIVRLCVQNALESKKKQLRLWLPDQTEQTVRKALSEMKDELHYDNLANEGFARTYIDWLYGVNLTRFATLKSGTLLRVGRVIVPIVKAVYERDLAIENFVEEIYYGIQSNAETKGEVIELSSQLKFKKDEYDLALKKCDEYNKQKAIVSNKKTKKEIINPGKLYSLTKLQNFLGKKYKMSMDQSLAIAQKLYESGYLTYPRTNSEYLATNEKDKIKQILRTIKGIGYPVEFKDKKTIFDDKKIESHSALTPTYKIPKKGDLSDDELKVYQAVFRRFVAVFCKDDCVALKTELEIKVGELESFKLKGMIIKEKGWTAYDDFNQKDKILPSLEINDEVMIDFKPKEKETTPPKHYTIETLNNYLKNPFKDDKAKIDEDNDEEDYKAIFEGLELGTEATRTGIIDNAIKSNYIELRKDVYYILKDGRYLIESLMQFGISMDKYKTSTLGQALKKVYRNEITVRDSVKIAENEIREVFVKKELPLEDEVETGFYGDEIGVCPICGGKVVRGRYGYGCLNYKEGCKFRINNVICKRIISINNARKLLSEGKTSKIKGFISKNNKSFDSVLTFDESKNIIFDFSK